MKLIKLLKQLGSYFKKDRLKLIVFCLLTFAVAFRGIIIPYLWSTSVGYLIEQDWDSFIKYFVVCQIAFLVFVALLSYPKDRLQNQLEINFMSAVSKDLFTKCLKLPVIAYEEHGVGEFINRIYTDPDRVIELLSSIIRLIARLFSIGAIFIIAINVSLWIALELAIFAIVIFFVSKKYYPKIKETSKKIKDESDEYVKEATQSLTGVREIKSLGIRKNIENFTFANIDRWFKEKDKLNKLEMRYYVNIDTLYTIMESAVLLTSAYLFFNGHTVYATFMLIDNFIWRINDAVLEFSQLGVNYNKIVASMTRISEILNNKLYTDASFGNKEIKDVKGVIKFDNVSFAYPGEEPTLKGLNLTIKPNKKIAIVGKSGMGKSTIFNLLLRFFDTTEGNIYIDDINIKEFNEESINKHISVIRQEPYLFNKTIKENFQLVKEDITIDEIRDLCKQSYIDEYIMNLPKGYDTLIGENGVNLSGGQKQRIAIARALTKDSKIILFDEATSALDNESQEYVKKSIDNLSKNHTIIIIAHRLSTIVDSDEIILIDEGVVASKGTHEKLLLSSNIYNSLYEREE